MGAGAQDEGMRNPMTIEWRECSPASQDPLHDHRWADRVCARNQQDFRDVRFNTQTREPRSDLQKDHRKAKEQKELEGTFGQWEGVHA
eukprot:3439645-Prymnesium_polylepis.2